MCHAPRFLLIALTGVALSACSYPSLDGDESLPEILAQLDSEIVGGTNVTSGWSRWSTCRWGAASAPGR